MFGPKIKLDKELHQRLVAAAEQAGYATTEEFILHVLERELEQLEQSGSDAEAEEQLRGLGYIE